MTDSVQALIPIEAVRLAIGSLELRLAALRCLLAQLEAIADMVGMEGQ